jgi:hypothetical protein
MTSKFVETENLYAFGIFEKILRKKFIFRKSNIGYGALSSNTFKTWIMSNTFKIILDDFEESILFYRKFINNF